MAPALGPGAGPDGRWALQVVRGEAGSGTCGRVDWPAADKYRILLLQARSCWAPQQHDERALVQTTLTLHERWLRSISWLANLTQSVPWYLALPSRTRRRLRCGQGLNTTILQCARQSSRSTGPSAGSTEPWRKGRYLGALVRSGTQGPAVAPCARPVRW